MELKDVLKDYKKLISLYRPVPLTPAEEIKEGGVYQLNWKEPAFLAVIVDGGRFVEVAPVSFAWPLATRLDLIVELPHPFSDLWIVQTDLMTSTSAKILEGAELIGELSKDDLELLKAVLKGERALPKERRGRGYGDPVHEEFKDFEYRRYKRLFAELLKEVESAERGELPFKERAEITLPPFVVKYLEEVARKL